MLGVDECLRIVHPELAQQLVVGPSSVLAAEHRLAPPRRERGVVTAERDAVPDLHQVVVPREVDEGVAPVEEDRIDHRG